MSTLEIIIERNKRKFSFSENSFELKQLSREKQHLLSKKQERELNQWECERLEKIEIELNQMIDRIDSAAISVSRITQAAQRLSHSH